MRMPVRGPRRSRWDIVPPRSIWLNSLWSEAARSSGCPQAQFLVGWQGREKRLDGRVAQLGERWWIPVRVLVLVDEQCAHAFDELAILEEVEAQPELDIERFLE